MKTTKRITTAMATALLGACLMNGAGAQIVATGPAGIFDVGTATTLYRLPSGAQGITNEATNDGFVIGAGRMLLHLDSNNLLKTLTQLPSGATADGIEVDQDGSYVIASSTDKRLYRVTQLATFKLKTLVTASTPIRRVTRDYDTGDFFVMDDMHVYSADRETGAMTTLFAKPTTSGTFNAIAHMPHSGNIVASADDYLFRLTRSGRVVSSVKAHRYTGLFVDYRTDQIWTSGWSSTSNAHIIGSFGLDVKLGWGSPVNFDARQIASKGQRRVVGIGEGFAGKAFGFKFTLTPSAPFCGALSYGARPSLRARGGRMTIAPDPLFFLTLCNNLPGITSGFTGNTNGLGQHRMWITIPRNVPSGTVFYASGATFLNGRIDFANTVCVKVR